MGKRQRCGGDGKEDKILASVHALERYAGAFLQSVGRSPSFAAYLAKKRAEGKHYNVAISHAAKKLVRLIFAMEKSGRTFQNVA